GVLSLSAAAAAELCCSAAYRSQGRWCAKLEETFMSNSTQVAVVRRLYEARGNPDIIRQVLAPDIRWEVVEGFPYSGVYVGLDDVLRNFFGRLVQDFESFVAVGTEFFESGDRVIALGSYTRRPKPPGTHF